MCYNFSNRSPELAEIAWGAPIQAIAISGRSGCGNTTVNHLVAEALGFRGINYTMRNYARDRGLSLEEVVQRAQADPNVDYELDRHQVQLSLEAAESGAVLSSRLAIWLLPKARLKVYLHASNEVRSQRIQMREGGSREQQMRATTVRDARDAERYHQLYGIDMDKILFADLFINTEVFDQNSVANMIVQAFRLRNHSQD